MTTTARVCLLWFAAVSAGCQTVEVQTYHGPQFDPSGIESYAWLPRGSAALGVVPENQAVLEESLRQSIDDNLARQGWGRLDPASADVWVRYVVGAESEYEVTKTGISKFAGQEVEVPVEVRNMRSGKLAIDLIDARSSQVVWRGVSGLSREGIPTHKEIRKSIPRVVKAVLQKLTEP